VADVGDESAPVVAGGRADRIVAAAELDNVATSRDCGVVARARRGRSIGGRSWELLKSVVIHVQHLNVVGHVVDENEQRAGWREGTRRRRCCVGGCLKRNVSHLPCPFSASFRDFFSLFSTCRPGISQLSRILQCPYAQPHMTKHFPPWHLPGVISSSSPPSDHLAYTVVYINLMAS
jgi:hypothetical protein